MGVNQDPPPSEIDDLDNPELMEFLSKARDRDGPYKCEVHRILKKPGASRETFSYVRQWSNEIPEYDQIGELYGPGDYRRQVWYTSKSTKKRRYASERFTIDPDFGQAAPYQRGAVAVASPSGGAADIGMQLAMTVFSKAMDALTTIAEAAVSGGSGGAQNLGALTEQIGTLTMSMFQQQQRMIEKVADAQLDHLFGDKEPEPDPQQEDPGIGGGIFELLRWLWRTYGEKLLGAAPFVQKIARERVSSLPQLKELYKDPSALSDAMTKLETEEGVPRDHVDRVLGILGLSRPDSVIFNGGKSEEGQGSAA